jgi:hypothetical protein
MRLIFAALLLTSFAVPETRYFHPVDCAKFADNGSTWTHVSVIGNVRKSHREKDGDIHLEVCDTTGQHCFEAEIVPYHPVSLFRAHPGAQVRVKGISRYDRQHKWWEIHPVEEIEVLQ